MISLRRFLVRRVTRPAEFVLINLLHASQRLSDRLMQR